MADEGITFAISDDGGTERLIGLLQQLGIIGEVTIDKIASGQAVLSRSAQDVVNNQTLMNTAIQAGVTNVTRLGEVLDSLSGIELKMAAETPEVIAELQAMGAATLEAAAAAEALVAAQAAAIEEAAGFAAAFQAETLELNAVTAAFATGADAAMAFRASQAFVNTETVGLRAAFGGIASASSELSERVNNVGKALGGLGTALTLAIGGAALGHEIDNVSNVNKQLGLLGLTSQAQEALFNRMTDAANKSQTSLHNFANSFGQINSVVEKYHGNTEDALRITTTMSELFYKTGTSAAGTARALHDFNEGLEKGKLDGQQLISFQRQAPQAFAEFVKILGVSSNALSNNGKASDALKAALQGQNIFTKLASQATADYVDHLNMASGVTGTIAGAFTVLQNKFEQYINTSGEASNIIGAFNLVLGALGDHLNYVVPLVGLFIGGLAIGKIAEAVDAFKLLGVAVYDIAGAFAAADLAMAPALVVVVGVTAGIVLLASKFGLLNSAIEGANGVIGVLSSGLKTVEDALVGSANAADAAKDKHTEHATAVSNDADMMKKLKDAIGSMTGSLPSNTTNLNTNTDALNKNSTAAINNANAHIQAALAAAQAAGINAPPGSVSSSSGGVTGVYTPGGAKIITSSGTGGFGGPGLHTLDNSGLHGIGGSSSGALGTPVSIPDLVNLSNNGSGVSSLSPSTVPDLVDLGASRNGSAYTVPGASGVDSRVVSMAVSPNERIIVQTPGQQAGNTFNNALPKFRDGGAYNVGYNAANDNSVTGYGTQNNLYTDSSGEVYSADSISAAMTAAAAKALASAATAVAAATTGDYVAKLGQLPGFTSGDTTSSGSTATHFDNAAYASAVAAWNKKVNDAVRNYTSIGGIQKPPIDGIGWSVDQRELYSTDGQRITVNPNYGFYNKTSGDFVMANVELALEARQSAGKFPQQSDYMKARDGLVYDVPGASGVDSRLIQLAVSPGEQVQVRTPGQQRDDAGTSNGRQVGRAVTVNQYFSGSDPANANRSRRQMASDARRALGK